MRKITKLVCFASITIVCFGIFYIAFEYEFYKKWVTYVAPNPHIFQVENTRRVAIQVGPNTEGIEWFGTRWLDNGKQVEIYNSRAQVYTTKLLMIDPKDGANFDKIKTIESGEFPGLLNALPVSLEDREYLWAGCQNENLLFTAKFIENNIWQVRLWEDSQLIKTFQPMEFHFGLYQSGFREDPVGLVIEYSHFSPDCRYAIISFDNDIWLLDTLQKSFVPIFTARHLITDDLLRGYSQSTWPSWAPNSREFVFGDGTFGLEKYNVLSKKRSWLLAPDIAGVQPEWSKTGKWILARSEIGLVIISPTSDKIGTLEENCESIEDIAWSPVDDKIAFICKNYDRNSCVEGKCPNERDYLVIWDLSNLDSN